MAAASRGILGKSRICAHEDSLELAVVDLEPGSDPKLAQDYPAVLSRCTNRRAAPREPLEAALIDALSRGAEVEGARLRVLTDSADLQAVAEMLGESDRIRYLSPALHAEMMSELRWSSSARLESGLDVRTLALDKTDLSKLSVARRSDVMAELRGLGRRSRSRREHPFARGVGVRHPRPYRRRRCTSGFRTRGVALQRCWIVAETHRIGLQPVSPVFLYAIDDTDIDTLVPDKFQIPLADLRDRFRDRVGVEPADTLVMVLRLTHGPRPDIRSQRMALRDVVRGPNQVTTGDSR